MCSGFVVLFLLLLPGFLSLEANANEKARGPPWKAGEFGESGKNGKLVKIADNNLEANANEKTRGPP